MSDLPSMIAAARQAEIAADLGIRDVPLKHSGSVYEHSKALLDLAIAIADAEVRTVIECTAHCDADLWMDTTQAAATKADAPEDVARMQHDISQALAYIALRGQNAFSFEMVRHPDKRHLIKFRSRP